MSQDDEQEILQRAQRAIGKLVASARTEEEKDDVCAVCFAAGIPTPTEIQHKERQNEMV